MSVLLSQNLLPFRQYAEAEVMNIFSLQGTGLAGQLVAFITGNQDPNTGAGSYSTTTNVGASFANSTSLRHNITRSVRPTQAGDTSFNTLGVTLHTTAEYDENGNRLILMPKDWVTERGFVLSGQAVPVLKRGVITVKNSSVISINTPQAGYPVVISTGGNGMFEVLDMAVATQLNQLTTGGSTYTGSQVIGKVYGYNLSGFQGIGYTQLAINL